MGGRALARPGAWQMMRMRGEVCLVSRGPLAYTLESYCGLGSEGSDPVNWFAVLCRCRRGGASGGM